MHYVYKVTNNCNGKVYIGKRKHNNPTNDSYMGSGKLIKLAIEKYGVSSFTKEIIEIFDTDEEASLLEKSLVTVEFIKSNNSYNMHEGGHGGFAHINSNPEMRELTSEASRQYNIEHGFGGDNSHLFTEESYRKMREGSKRGVEKLRDRSDDEKSLVYAKISNSSKGERNSQYGTVWCVEETATDCSNRKRFKVIPSGWVSTKQWKENKKDKSKGSYGKHWYNDGVTNYFLSPESNVIIDNKLVRGRKTA